MTVEELIFILNSVEDKSKIVEIPVHYTECSYEAVSSIEENDTIILL